MKDLNEVVIIGGNHHNTLSAIRCFGKSKINFKIVVHENSKSIDEMMLSHSKYSKKIYVIDDDMESIKKWLLDNKSTCNKQVVIPCSDLAEYTIDKYFTQLNKYYYIPGFEGRPGEVCRLMDKYEQKQWADNYNVLMAKSWVFSNSVNEKELKKIPIPCIVKPCISAFGKKGDIKVCRNFRELKNAIQYYIENSYKKILVQEFLEKEYEICSLGCILDKNIYYGKIIKKIREYPKTGGSASFAKFIDDQEIQKFIDLIISNLAHDGYRGLYDIDILRYNNKYYLNEINFRNSGNAYAIIKSGIKTPYLFYVSKVNGKLLDTMKVKGKNIFFIDDISSFLSLKKRELSLSKFLIEFFKSSAHSIFDLLDFGVIKFYLKEKFYGKN